MSNTRSKSKYKKVITPGKMIIVSNTLIPVGV